MSDLAKAFDHLISRCWYRYRGCLAEVLPNGRFRRGNKEYESRGELEQAIDQSIENISNSIKFTNNDRRKK